MSNIEGKRVPGHKKNINDCEVSATGAMLDMWEIFSSHYRLRSKRFTCCKRMALEEE